ncbi:hypothetical protein FAZ69_23615 [Trinickia terrae]|uniref:Uncharacterized protein n=1 Tax=Trinickia terrae TaxID=2571161 RepID=A0A4U1HTL7_9BURK|nr:hypothetical protein [Trinickia terrae]TKC83478.1 hypothetical protein FAZ69_23615 [Trinickia terrae]
MRKNDHEAGQMSLDFTPPADKQEKNDYEMARRPVLTIVVSNTACDVPPCSMPLRKLQEKAERDIYSQEVTNALHAFADRLRW